MMMTDIMRGEVALETTNQNLSRLKQGLFDYLEKHFEDISAYAMLSFDEIEPKQEKALYKAYVPHEKVTPFSEILFYWIDKKHLEDVELYKKAQIDRRLFSKMKSPEYTPEKTTVFKLILAMELTLREAKEFLEKVGYSFSYASKSDLIVKYCIENRVYDLFTVNEWLNENGQKPL